MSRTLQHIITQILFPSKPHISAYRQNTSASDPPVKLTLMTLYTVAHPLLKAHLPQTVSKAIKSDDSPLQHYLRFTSAMRHIHDLSPHAS